MEEYKLPERITERINEINEEIQNLQEEFQTKRENLNDIIHTFVLAQGIDPETIRVELSEGNRKLNVIELEQNEEE